MKEGYCISRVNDCSKDAVNWVERKFADELFGENVILGFEVHLEWEYY